MGNYILDIPGEVMYIGCMEVKMKNEQSLTPDEINALVAAAKYFGRRWKMELNFCWMASDYPSALDAGTLQTLRNSESFGPRGLRGYRLPKAAAC